VIGICHLSRGGLAADLVSDAGFLYGPDAQLMPTGYGHVFDWRGFDDALRIGMVTEEREALVRFTVDHNGAGEHAMAQAVLGGFLPAFGTGRPF